MRLKNSSFIKILLITFLIFFLSSCFFNKETTIDTNSGTLDKNLNVEQNSAEEKIGEDYYKKLDDLLVSGNYKELIDNLEKKGVENLDGIEAKVLMASYLKYGNSFFKEEENSEKAMELLDKLEENFEVLYYKGYSSEIIKDYEKALEYYNEGLADKNITKEWKITLFNQIGHVYDLQGSLVKANLYYLKAERLSGDNLNAGINLQRGRVEYRKGNIDEAIEYFNKALDEEKNKFVRSEIYSNLSNIFSNKDNGLEQAIKYAQDGIGEQENYFGNYVVLGLAYMKKGGEDMIKAKSNLEKAIELYPETTNGYKYLGIYYYIEDDFEKAIESFKKQLENNEKDVTIMGEDKEELKYSAIYDISRSYALNGDVSNSVKYLKILLGEGDNQKYFQAFMLDFSFKGGPFYKIINEEEFKDYLISLMKIYNK